MFGKLEYPDKTEEGGSAPPLWVREGVVVTIKEIKSKLNVVLGVEDNKYPRLELNDEEQRMASKEGMSFPKYYPLTR